MYEQYGPIVDHVTRKVEFKLFFPDNSKDILQFVRGGLPKIAEIRIPGTFNATGWDEKLAPAMTLEDHPSGLLYVYSTILGEEGFYQYKFYVRFKDGTDRWVNDPCTRYGARLGNSDNSGFVVGGQIVGPAKPIEKRLSPQDLIIYEMMVDNFVEKLPSDGSKNKLDVVEDRVPYLVDMGITALEMLPWTSVPGASFDWGYGPFSFVSVDDRLTDRKGVAPQDNLNRLFSLKLLIDELHKNKVHVIMDGVFNHATSEFPYLQLYQNKKDCPYIGDFEGGGFFEEIDFNNACARQFVFDVCKYWIKKYEIDGIRFDYVKGFFRKGAGDPGITLLIKALRRFLIDSGRENFSFILENLPDNRFLAVSDANQINATGTWFDPLMFEAFDSGRTGRIHPRIIRALNANKDYDTGKGSITYIENHDHGTLVNKIGGDRVGVDRNLHWFRTQPYAIALFTAPGTVMIHNGQEFGDEYFLPEQGSDRVIPRPLNWDRATDNAGETLTSLYKKLIKIREEYPGLKSSNFFPDNYDEGFTRFDAEGYGVDTERQVIIFHRWGTGKDGGSERFMILLNCSSNNHFVDIPFPLNGTWTDLLTGESFLVTDFRCKSQEVNSNFGRIFHIKG